jgi:hypothetical protein
MDKLEEWETKADIAAGWIYLMVESKQRIHLTNICDDPIKMWKALESIYLQSALHTLHRPRTPHLTPRNLLDMPAVALLILQIPTHHYKWMQTLIGMQTLVPLLI